MIPKANVKTIGFHRTPQNHYIVAGYEDSKPLGLKPSHGRKVYKSLKPALAYCEKLSNYYQSPVVEY
jgi:hypothetical protein